MRLKAVFLKMQEAKLKKPLQMTSKSITTTIRI